MWSGADVTLPSFIYLLSDTTLKAPEDLTRHFSAPFITRYPSINDCLNGLFVDRVRRYVELPGIPDHPTLYEFNPDITAEDVRREANNRLLRASLFLRALKSNDRLPADNTWKLRVCYFYSILQLFASSLILKCLQMDFYYPTELPKKTVRIQAGGSSADSAAGDQPESEEKDRLMDPMDLSPYISFTTCSESIEVRMTHEMEAMLLLKPKEEGGATKFDAWIHTQLLQAAGRFTAA